MKNLRFISKNLIFVFFLFLGLTLNLDAQKIGEIPVLKDPHSVHVQNNKLVFLDEYTVNVYSIDPFLLEYQFARQGDGPDQFKYWPQLIAVPDCIVGLDYLKMNWFTLDGKLNKVKQFSEIQGFDPSMEMILKPVKDNFVAITASHELSRRYISLLNSNFEPIKKLYEGKYDWGDGNSFHILSYRIEVICYDDKIFIMDNEKGFIIEVFDDKGEHLYTIDKNNEVEKVRISEGLKQKTIDEILETQPDWMQDMVQNNPQFFEYYPAINHFQVDNDNIYVITDNISEDKNEIIIMDLDGKIINRMFVLMKSKHYFRRILRYDPYTIKDGILYEIFKNQESEKWEFYQTDFK